MHCCERSNYVNLSHDIFMYALLGDDSLPSSGFKYFLDSTNILRERHPDDVQVYTGESAERLLNARGEALPVVRYWWD